LKLAMAKRRGSLVVTALKHHARKLTIQLLQRLAFYASPTAGGDLVKLVTFGFAVSSLPQRVAVPAEGPGIESREGRREGQMVQDLDKNSAAGVYEYQLGQVDDHGMPGEGGESYTTTSSKFNVVAPLTPFLRYGVRVRAINGYGRSDWSEMVSHVVR